MTWPPSDSEPALQARAGAGAVPVAGQAPSPFARLHPRIQRWIWDQQWSELRDTQARAVSPVLDGRLDVIISAATASGKTEAAFLPICSALLAAREAADPPGTPGLPGAPGSPAQGTHQ